ncbi:MAG: YkgJ family cysteine cluster protein [Parachlamydia sp.]|nr:YkgJ family cysteine cluster protein [Parachlamydia sp.]
MHDENASKTLPWYRDGLRFKCTECGKCCTGSPGYVWVTEQEIDSMAKQIDLSVELFKRKYLRQRDNRYALAEKKSQNRDCIFLKDNKCTIYQARPAQCRTFPFWKENLNSEESWKLASEACEGIHDQAPLIPYSIIQELLER